MFVSILTYYNNILEAYYIHIFTITLYRSKTIAVIVHIEAHPHKESTMACMSHISGP